MLIPNQTIRSLRIEGGNNNFWLVIHRNLKVTPDVLSRILYWPERNNKHFFLKKNVFFEFAFTLLVLSLSVALLIMLLNKLPISVDGPLNSIYTHVSIKVETYYVLLNP